MNKDDKIYVAGHTGMVGSAIVRELKKQGYNNLILRTHAELDLTNQEKVNIFFSTEKPDYVFLAAARVGGILVNSNKPSEFLYENIMIEMNVINSAWKNGVKKLLFLGSSCIYPRNAQQPIKEKYLLSDYLEQTNEGYALAKISGLKFCEYLHRQYGVNFISVMPTNLYGPNDNYDLTTSHVLPALIKKIVDAKESGADVVCWGDGSASRDFMHSHDFANLCIELMNKYNDAETINAATGIEITIKKLVDIICEIVGYTGNIYWDKTKPNGTIAKQLDLTKLNKFGWKPSIDLITGITDCINDYTLSKGNF